MPETRYAVSIARRLERPSPTTAHRKLSFLLRFRRPALRARRRRRDAYPCRVGARGRFRLLARRRAPVVVVGPAGRTLDSGGLRAQHCDDSMIEEEPALRAPAINLPAGSEHLRHGLLLAGQTQSRSKTIHVRVAVRVARLV